MLRLVTVCQPPTQGFYFLLWASRRLYCHDNNNNSNNNNNKVNFMISNIVAIGTNIALQG